MGYYNYVIAKEKKNIYLKLRLNDIVVTMFDVYCCFSLYHGGIFIDISE